MSDLFDQAEPPVVIDPTKDYFSELVGPDKKFKSEKELALGKAHSDAHIANLEKTLAGLREEVAKRKTTEDLMDHINKALTAKELPPTRMPDPLAPNGDVKSGLTAEDVQKLLADRDNESIRRNNTAIAAQKLQELYGETAATEITKKAQELGVNKDYLKNMAESSPSVFLALFSAPQKNVQKDIFNAPPQNSYRPPENSHNGPKMSDFKKVKDANPTEYWKPAFQRKMIEAAEQAMEKGYYEQFMAN